MKKLICTDNFVGFLCAVYSFFKDKNADAIINEKIGKNFLDDYSYAPEDIETARKVRRGLIEKGGQEFYSEFEDAYLSGNPLKEEILLNYLKLFFRHGRDAFSFYDHTEVIAFKDILNKVRHETGRLCGFIRLMETESGVYYGYFSSDNDILEKIAANFVSRFNCQSFVLHDYKRQKICVWDGKRLDFVPVENGVEITLSEREKIFQSLWKQYHSTVSIKDRENKRLQRQFLPKKYRHFMHEF